MKNVIQPSIQPVQPLLRTPASIPTSSPSNWSKIILFSTLGLIIIVGLLLIGVQIGKSQITNQHSIVAQPTILPTQTTINPAIIPTQTDSPTTFPSTATTSANNSTTNWKTYTNNLLKYSIKYPQNWLLSDLTEGKQIQIYYQPNKTESVGEILIEEINSSAYNLEINSDQNAKDIIIGETVAKCKTDNVTKTWCFLTSDNRYLFIIIVERDDQEYNKILDQILASFKFIN